MMKPTVHLNGTSEGELLKQLGEARVAVLTAEEKLRKAWPNGRDYYPQGDRALMVAETEWRERSLALKGIADDLYKLMEHVMDTGRNGRHV
jgi:hypothetical protein